MVACLFGNVVSFRVVGVIPVSEECFAEYGVQGFLDAAEEGQHI